MSIYCCTVTFPLLVIFFEPFLEFVLCRCLLLPPMSAVVVCVYRTPSSQHHHTYPAENTTKTPKSHKQHWTYGHKTGALPHSSSRTQALHQLATHPPNSNSSSYCVWDTNNPLLLPIINTSKFLWVIATYIVTGSACPSYVQQ